MRADRPFPSRLLVLGAGALAGVTMACGSSESPATGGLDGSAATDGEVAGEVATNGGDDAGADVGPRGGDDGGTSTGAGDDAGAGTDADADGGVRATDASTTTGTLGPRSGLPWMSGSNGDPSMEAKYFDAFGTWRGRPDDVAMMYTDRTSWSSITGADSFVFSFMKNWPGKLVISQPFFPNDGSNLSDCAAGSYDTYWKTFGSALVSNDRADSIVRIGWEFNGDFMYWHATNDTAAFIACWNHVASAIKSTDPEALCDWTINSHFTPSDSCMGDATNCYPGDQYVDYIGIDDYDEYPPSTTTPFDTIATATGGITWIYDFAVRHQKRFAVGEWGVVSSAGTNGGGDNPAFVENMHDWFVAHAAVGLYESYFSISSEVDSQIVDNTTMSCGCDNPMASAKYLSLWHP
jgi:hypothetical protein